jgi:hypothetical protein
MSVSALDLVKKLDMDFQNTDEDTISIIKILNRKNPGLEKSYINI